MISSTTRRYLVLAYCPYCNHFTDSNSNAQVDSHGETRPQSYPLDHRKPDSSPQGPQFHTPAEGISNRKGDRAAPRDCPQAVPLRAPGRYNDLDCIPPWAARLGSVRPAVGSG